MNVIHICTTDSFRAGCEDFPPVECWLCGNKTAYISWCDCRCDTCGADQGELAWSIRTARAKCGKTRKEFAEIMGVKPKTVSVYDWYPSKRYVEKARAYFRELYSVPSA